MYLTELNPNTGLIKDDKDQDGWLSIKSFRDLVNDKRFGLRAFTAVALFSDYLSPIRHYSEKERNIKAIDTVYDKRKDILWNNDLVQEAIIDYKSLQFDHTIEEKKMLEEMKFSKLSEISSTEGDEDKVRLLSSLSKINQALDEFNKKHKDEDLFTTSPVINGYKLSRLEQKMLNNKSFYYVRKREEIQKPGGIETKE